MKIPNKTFGKVKDVKYSKRIAVRAIIEREGKIILNQNLEGNFYELPGGGKEKETLKETVMREVKEETGLKISSIKKLAVVNEIIDTKIKNKFCVSHCYICKSEGDLRTKPEKGLKVVLVSPREAIRLIRNSKISNSLAKYAKVRDIYFITQFLKKI